MSLTAGRPPTLPAPWDPAALVAALALCLAAFLFGATFVVVKEAITVIPPLSFIAWRFLLGGVVLALFALPRTGAVWRRSLRGPPLRRVRPPDRRARPDQRLQLGADHRAVCGLHPVVGGGGEPVSRPASVLRIPTLVGVLLAFVGLAMLTVGDGLSLAAGDLLTVGCAIAFACHIVALAALPPSSGCSAHRSSAPGHLCPRLWAGGGDRALQPPTAEVLVAFLLTGWWSRRVRSSSRFGRRP